MAAVAASIPNVEAASKAWEEAGARALFWRENYQDFLEKYPEQFVAVADGEVVAADSDLDKLLGILKSRGFEPQRVWIQFITANARRVMP